MTVTLYHNPRCSKSRRALELLRARGVEPAIIEYLKTPPSADELRRILALMGMTPRQLLRAKESAQAGLDDPALDETALITAMVAHPAVIERPIAVTATAARLGRPPERVLEVL
ncbi:MAG: arsenate reductase (glutaredoxin) [Defluviicoccus sp.]